MFLIFFVLSQFEIPLFVQVTVGLIGGALMVFMGVQTFRNRHKQETAPPVTKRDSIFAGIYTSAANAGFILWWLTIGTALVLNAKLFGLLGFSVFAGVHWSVDFLWYSIVGFAIFKSQRFWNERVRMGVLLFCVSVFVGFGLWFFGSALWSVVATVI
jgi:threonine/homoserine/homoserine lactone efflux protein